VIHSLLAAVKKVEWEVRDFPELLRRDLKSGRFTLVLNDYAARREIFYKEAAEGRLV